MEMPGGMSALFIEWLVIVIVGALSIGDGIRLILKQDMQTQDVLGPGFYSVGLGAILVIAGCIHFFAARGGAASVKNKPPVGQSAEEKAFKKTMISMIVAMIAYLVLMDFVGYFLASVIFFLLINMIVGFRSWLSNVGVTALMTAAFYLIFASWLGIVFPRGLLFDLLIAS
jgi:putative tricarboxylic transport membrane protein